MPAVHKPFRKKLFVDANVQGALLKRIVLYWCYCLLFITVPILIGKTLAEPEYHVWEHFGRMVSVYWPVFAAAVLLLPFMLYDVLRLSNRFVGPLFRLRREMGRFADGEQVRPVHFRDDDFWQDLADCFNDLIDRVSSSQPDDASGSQTHPDQSSKQTAKSVSDELQLQAR